MRAGREATCLSLACAAAITVLDAVLRSAGGDSAWTPVDPALTTA